MTFGNRLNECMERANISQRQLAAIVGATPTQLNYWVKDKRQPDIPYIRKLAQALNVSTDYLICNDEYVNTSNSTVSERAMMVAQAYDLMSDYGKSLIDMIIKQEETYTVLRIPLFNAAHDSDVYARYNAKKEVEELENEPYTTPGEGISTSMVID